MTPRVKPPTWGTEGTLWVDPHPAGPWRFDPSTGHYIEGPFGSAPPWVLSYQWSAAEIEAIRRAQDAGLVDYLAGGQAAADLDRDLKAIRDGLGAAGQAARNAAGALGDAARGAAAVPGWIWWIGGGVLLWALSRRGGERWEA